MVMSRRSLLNRVLPSSLLTLVYSFKTQASTTDSETLQFNPTVPTPHESIKNTLKSDDLNKKDDFINIEMDDFKRLLEYKNTRFDRAYSYSLIELRHDKVSLFEFIPEFLHEPIRKYEYFGDLSKYVQEAIDAVSNYGGGVIHCPPGQYFFNVKTKPYVVLLGSRVNSIRRAIPWSYDIPVSPFSTRFRNFKGSEWVISSATDKQSDVTSRGFGVIGIDLDAKDDSNSKGGIRLRGPEFCVKSCSFYGFQDQGLEVSGNIGLIEDVVANECLKNRDRKDFVGTVEVSGASDCQIHRVEGNAQVVGLNSIHSDLPYICGIKIVGSNHYVSNLMGEISETGIYISSGTALHKAINCRADNNAGPGYIIQGVMGSNLHSYNNSRSGNGKYSGFETMPKSSRLLLSNCIAETDVHPVDGTKEQRKHKYGFDFYNMDFLSLKLKPWINQCVSYGHDVGWISVPEKHGIQSTPTIGILFVNPALTPNPNVDGVSIISVKGTTHGKIKGFKGGIVGQQIDIYVDSSFPAELVNSESFVVDGVNNNSGRLMVFGRIYKFIKTDIDTWREKINSSSHEGQTSERPSENLSVGMIYFDTALNKPVWRNSDNNGWVDALGKSV